MRMSSALFAVAVHAGLFGAFRVGVPTRPAPVQFDLDAAPEKIEEKAPEPKVVEEPPAQAKVPEPQPGEAAPADAAPGQEERAEPPDDAEVADRPPKTPASPRALEPLARPFSRTVSAEKVATRNQQLRAWGAAVAGTGSEPTILWDADPPELYREIARREGFVFFASTEEGYFCQLKLDGGVPRCDPVGATPDGEAGREVLDDDLRAWVEKVARSRGLGHAQLHAWTTRAWAHLALGSAVEFLRSRGVPFDRKAVPLIVLRYTLEGSGSTPSARFLCASQKDGRAIFPVGSKDPGSCPPPKGWRLH